MALYSPRNACACDGRLGASAALALAVAALAACDRAAARRAAALALSSVAYHAATRHAPWARAVDVALCAALAAHLVRATVAAGAPAAAAAAAAAVGALQLHPACRAAPGGPLAARYQLATQLLAALWVALLP